MKTRFGPEGLIMNVEFEGGIQLSPLYDIKPGQVFGQQPQKKEEINHGTSEEGQRSGKGVGREDEEGARSVIVQPEGASEGGQEGVKPQEGAR
jgi:hypothetical protein